MIRRFLFAAACAAALLPALTSPGLAEETRTVVLKERLVSEDAVVTLADLFDNAGEAGGAVLARAAAPGEQLSLEPSYVQREAARHGLSWSNAGGLARITVERAARTVTAEALGAIVEETLFMETGETHEVSLSATTQTLYAPTDTLGAPRLVSIEHDARSGLFRAEMAAWPEGPVQRISGRVVRVIDVPVLAATLARGEVIEEGDLSWTRLPADRVRADMLVDLSAMVGQAARRPLREGAPLRAMDLQAPVLIARGETVSLVYRSGPLVLTARARALQDAAAGEVARFVNLQSNRTIEAVAEAPGRARVAGSAYTH
ncbi:MAG: flagellar basal body P-ring formation chaperone FlgA [Oceanicaulis sp.]